MQDIDERYISLLTDFGFKRIFGTEPNKELLICFLNCLFEGTQKIKDIKYLNTEHLGETRSDRKAIFDVYCEGENGEKFIVEMQNAYQEFFKDRSIFYSTFPIREQGKRSEWDFNLSPVYTVALLNFDMKDISFDAEDLKHLVMLHDSKTKKVFYDKLQFIYVEISKFNKREDELETLFDKWLYVLKNLPKLEKRPAALREKIFDRLFKVAEIAKFTQQELREYEDSRKAYRDLKNSLDTALRDGFNKGMREGMAKGMEEGRAKGMEEGRAKGMEEGRAKGRTEIASTMLAKGMDIDTVSELTGLTKDEIQKLI